MTWQAIEGHDEVVEHFQRALRRGRLASTFLFVGPPGVGKRLFAEKLAQALLCQQSREHELAPCGGCDACTQVAARTHPDLLIVEKPSGKSFIPLDAFLGDKEHRMREGLCHDIALKPFMGGRKVAIVDDADYLNEEGANALLKTLEEPPPGSVLILIGTSVDRQLPTIRSRCQVVRFRPLDRESVASILESRGLVADVDQARRLAEFSDGSVEWAVALADEGLWTFRGQLLQALADARFQSVALARATSEFVDAAGKEASPRRARTRQIMAFAADFYRQLLRAQAGLEPTGDEPLVRAVEKAQQSGPGDVETTAACVERTLAALNHIDRNAHQTTLIECWLDDLAQTLQTGQPVAGVEV
jgi:DNA polymerase-3 subunit delta'